MGAGCAPKSSFKISNGRVIAQLHGMPMSHLNKNDITLKQLTLSNRSSFFELATGSRAVSFLDKELIVARTLYTDSLVQLEDGRICQIEFQSSPDESMAWRMFEYRALMLMRLRRDRSGALPPIVQRVYYTGSRREPLIPTSFTHDDGLRLDFEVVDIRGQFEDGRSLLASHEPLDWILGLLCKPTPHSGDESGRRAYWTDWQRIADKLRKAPPDGFGDPKVLFEFAASIRGIKLQSFRGWTAMPFTAKLSDTVIVKQIHADGIDTGKTQKAIDVISRFYERSSPLSDKDKAVLAKLREDQLDAVLAKAWDGLTFNAAISSLARQRRGSSPPSL